MTYSRLFLYPISKTQLQQQPFFSKRVAKARRCPRNIRKHQVKIGQIVYYHGGRGVVPMRVFGIDDCSLWSKSFKVTGTTTNRNDFMIYYDLQPLTEKYGKWRAVDYKDRPRNWKDHNARLWDNGWIGHAVDMDQFCLTYAEAKWAIMHYR